MDIGREDVDGEIIVELNGRLDIAGSKTFETFIRDLIDGSSTEIVVNMAGVEYVDSSGLRSLLIAAKKIRSAGRDLVLSGLRPNVLEVFDISGFSMIFKII